MKASRPEGLASSPKPSKANRPNPFLANESSTQESEAIGSNCPHDSSLELDFLICLLLEWEGCQKRGMEGVSEDWFFDLDHRLLWRTAQKLVKEDLVPDLALVGGEHPQLGMKLATAAEGVISTAHFESWRDRLRHLAESRALLKDLLVASLELQNGVLASQVRADLEKSLRSQDARYARVPIQSLGSLAPEVRELTLPVEKRVDVPHVGTGFEELDHMLMGGFARGQFHLIAGRPSMGKTTLALNMALNMTMRKLPVGFLTLEMQSAQVALNALSNLSGISGYRLRRGTYEESFETQIEDCLGRMADLPLYLIDRSRMEMQDVAAVARRLQYEHQIYCLFVDYLQLLRPTHRRDSREREVAELSLSLKDLAKDLDLPIVTLCQLNRAVDARPDHRPLMSDLRESGSLEQDADTVMFIYRPGYYEKDKKNDDGNTEVILSKQRIGPTGVVHLRFMKEAFRFEGMDELDDFLFQE